MKIFWEPIEKLKVDVQNLVRTVDQVQKAKAANKVGFFQVNSDDTSSVFTEASFQLGKVLNVINHVTHAATLNLKQ